MPVAIVRCTCKNALSVCCIHRRHHRHLRLYGQHILFRRPPSLPNNVWPAPNVSIPPPFRTPAHRQRMSETNALLSLCPSASHRPGSNVCSHSSPWPTERSTLGEKRTTTAVGWSCESAARNCVQTVPAPAQSDCQRTFLPPHMCGAFARKRTPQQVLQPSFGRNLIECGVFVQFRTALVRISVPHTNANPGDVVVREM